ncbi:phenylacetic acid degradation protein [Hazenella sp. IB182357]|uniref:Phenylacetic acid degradation protein n=1 Tax=Polycladospora coralii TaxID=2771432 RepID=A0A926NA47_9BACL|nr:phenylacetic acid degradation protein [Polycladospora coralii]MBD1373041.1 phenylacetic acid degradation protein [Polycladospora coralii]MBS7529614.1 phenylacetic acid degradation protein [Polycladospora coralii]
MQNNQNDVYEVFVQKSHAEQHQHVGSLIAPSPDMAVQMARENFLRRDHAVNLWVVPQSQVTSSTYGGRFFAREMDRGYREVKGYTENGRLWRMFREKVMTLEEIVAFVEEKERGETEGGER